MSKITKKKSIFLVLRFTGSICTAVYRYLSVSKVTIDVTCVGVYIPGTLDINREADRDRGRGRGKGKRERWRGSVHRLRVHIILEE